MYIWLQINLRLLIKHMNNKSGTSKQTHHHHALVDKFLYCFVFLISFHFAYASMMTTVDSKVINNKNRIYFNIYDNLLFI